MVIDSIDKIPVSACIIAQDEEHYIKKAIQNVKLMVGEVVVLDGGSKDLTVPICETLGCKVHHREFDFDFSAQRNHAMSLCKNDWILWLDADEYFSEDFFNILPEIVLNSDLSAIKINRVSIFDGQERGRDFQWRLIRKSQCHWVNRIHENLVVKGDWKKLPEAYYMVHEHTMNRQLYNNALYYNVNNNIMERPKDNEGMESHNDIWVKKETKRNG